MSSTESPTDPEDISNLLPEIIPHDFQAADDIPLPTGARRIGGVVCKDGGPNFSDVAVLLEPSFSPTPGQFLAALHHSRRQWIATVLQVGDVVEVNPNESPELSAARKSLGLAAGYAGEGQSTRIFRIAQTKAVEEIELAPDSWDVISTSAVSNLVRSGDPVVVLPDGLLVRSLGLLDDPSQGIDAGTTYGADQVRAIFKPVVLQLGTLVCGNPGRGKSYFCGDIIEEAVAWKIPMLAIDINGELIETAKALGGLVITLPDPSQFGLTMNLLTPPELLSITPGVDPNTQYAELIELAHEHLKANSHGSRIRFPQLTAKIEELGERLQSKPASIKTAVARVSKLEDDPLFAGEEFDFIATLIKHGLVVLDCRYISLRQTRLIAAAAARHLQAKGRDMTRAANDGDADAASWFSLLFVDEAHTVVPASEAAVSTQVLYELARMGRHVRTGLILASQSPSDLDSSVLKRLQTRFIFALESDQLRAIPGIHADLDERLIRQLPKLPQGVCAVSGTSEVINHGFLMKSRKRRTPVGGGTPKVFDSRSKA